jgi:hypothetical protein
MKEAALEVRRDLAFAGVSIDKALLYTSKVRVPLLLDITNFCLCIAIESNLTPVPEGLPVISSYRQDNRYVQHIRPIV